MGKKTWMAGFAVLILAMPWPAAADVAADVSPLAGVSALAGGAAAVSPAQQVCVVGFSKDFCSLRLNSGTWNNYSCTVPDVTSCRTLSGIAASAGGFFVGHGGTCEPGVPCDEAPELDGRFEAVVDVHARRNAPCPSRGAWGGTFQLLDADTYSVLLASGTIDGTLGVGTHRVGCGEQCGPNCEGCHVARWDPLFSVWYLHSEGFIQGTVHEGPHAGCELRASFQGEFTADGDRFGPLPPNYNWGFCGTADGVLLCPCQ